MNNSSEFKNLPTFLILITDHIHTQKIVPQHPTFNTLEPQLDYARNKTEFENSWKKKLEKSIHHQLDGII